LKKQIPDEFLSDNGGQNVMSLIVQKFGGSSVANAERLRNVADIITKTYSQNNDVVVVVSAQGDTTDDLIAKAKEVNSRPSKREMDMLLTAGEQMSASLLAMTIEQMGFPVVSLLGWQAGFLTDTSYGSARIKRVTPDRIKKELDKRNIVVVTGFQGINRYNDMTTLGRGGSDTSAVAIAAVMHADLCQIYTDVEGVYTADPRKIKNAKKIDVISYDEMLELATLGAQVLNNRSVEMAKKYNIELEVLSSYNRVPGTIVKEATKMEKMLISGIAKDDGVARVAIIGVPDRPGLAFKVFSKLSAKNVNVDIILQSIGRNGTKDISFTVSEDHLQATMEVLTPYVEQIGASSVVYDEDVAKISIVGAGMETHPGVAAMMFEALFESNINIQMISTSEIKISVLIERKDADKAVAAIHNKFFPEVVDQ
jgi:aspartate kinase